jgi:UDP-glucose 4-epimerase
VIERTAAAVTPGGPTLDQGIDDAPRDAPSVAGSRWVVTGGLGFIGSNVALHLAHAGASVVVVDRMVPTHGGDPRNLDGAPANLEVVQADIGDPVVAELLEGADAVCNLAGQVSHVASMEAPLRDLDLNARAQLAFLEHARRVAPGAPIVYASTRQVYGRPRYLPVDEEHPTNPVDVNGIDKLAAEQFHLLYAQVHGLRTSALRLTNVYGPRQSLRHPDLGFLPVFIRRALDDEAISLYGEGDQLRDCLYVDDVVAGFLAAAATADAVGQVFHLGHPEAHSLRAIADAIVGTAGAGRVVPVPWPPESARIDIGSFHGDYAKAKAVLGWEPSVDLREGVARTLAFYGGRPWYRSST